MILFRYTTIRVRSTITVRRSVIRSGYVAILKPLCGIKSIKILVTNSINETLNFNYMPILVYTLLDMSVVTIKTYYLKVKYNNMYKHKSSRY